ncbi:MAG TPA: RidA family protein [Anaerolineae bacterium]|nr:RidA family protein [Anaerolineae bacterium]
MALDSDSTASDLVYTSGQTGVIYDSNRFAGDDIESQTRQTLTNLKAELEASGSCLENVLKTTVYLADVREFSRMNGVYAEFFREAPPARATVQPSALPDGARVQIEAVAYREG